ncbi:tRNA glutamyl-Q(34) synthetase GluQRS [Maricurvus nonylphenolicus]
MHIGSLVTAVASFLDARSQQGTWLVRMEDLDPPREQPGAADAIIRSLEAHGLFWDEALVYQSQRLDSYHALVQQLQKQELAFRCNCSRQVVKQAGGIYPGHCRQQPPGDDQTCAVRVKTCQLPDEFTHSSNIQYRDIFQGNQAQQVDKEVGDFIIRRRDGLIAYQLAVVADDIAQKITHVIRGSDLLDNTQRQLWLFQLLKGRAPEFGHIPIVVNEQGQKLSKQTYAPALDDTKASSNLAQAMQLLHHPLPTELQGATPTEILQWGIEHWSREKIPQTLQITG